MSKTTLPLITIGITCYNAEDTIRRAVACALAQTWENSEIIVVDDCSTDSSWRILQALARERQEVRLIRHEKNGGYPAALNTLLSEAGGEFIAFFDDDDESVPERLTRQIERITTYEAAHESPLIMCYSNRSVIRAGESVSDHIGLAIGHQPPEPYGSIVADYILGGVDKNPYCWGMGIFGSCTMMVRRSVFTELGGFDVSFRRCAEMDFAIRAAFAGAHFISVDAPLITQYKTVTNDKSVEINFNYWLQLRKKNRPYLRKRRAYWGALALHHMNLHRTQRNQLRAWTWGVVAFFCLPLRVSLMKIGRRIALSRFFPIGEYHKWAK